MNTPMINRRGFLGLSAAGVAAVALSGCTVSPSGSQGSGSSGTGGITIMGNEGEINKAVIDAWEQKNPEAPITLIKYDETRLNAMLAAGSPPDLVRGAGAQITPYLATRKIAKPLDDYIAKSTLFKSSDLESVNDVWKWDGTTQGEGQTYGLTKDWSLDMMFWYNTSVFEEVGAKAPDSANPPTYDDLLEIAKTMTKSEAGKVTRYGLFATTPDVAVLQGMLATTGVSLFNEDFKKVDFSSPEAQKAIRWLGDVAKAKAGYTLVDPNPDGWDWPPFSSQRQAMASGGYWVTGIVGADTAAPGFARMAPAPLLGTQRVSPTTSATGHWIPEKAKNADGSFAFLEWFTAGQPAVDRAATGGGLPVIKSLRSNLPAKEAFQKAALETQQAEEKYAKVLSFSPYATVTALTAAVSDLFPKLVQGSLTAGQFADQANAKCNALLDEGVSRIGG